MGSFSMCIGYWIGIVSMGFSGHMKVMVVTGAVASVVSIHTSGAIWVGRLVVVVLHICKEHLEAIAVLLFAYRAATFSEFLVTKLITKKGMYILTYAVISYDIIVLDKT